MSEFRSGSPLFWGGSAFYEDLALKGAVDQFNLIKRITNIYSDVYFIYHFLEGKNNMYLN